jgi:hypothetical protein
MKKVNITLDMPNLGFGNKDFLVSLKDEQGHEIKDLFFQVEFSPCGDVQELKSSDPSAYSQAELYKSRNEKGFHSVLFDGTEGTNYDEESVRAFFDIEDDEDEDSEITASLKEAIADALIEKMDRHLFELYAGDGVVPSSDDMSKEISFARAKNFLSKFPYIVAYNPLGHVSAKNTEWTFHCFETLEAAKEFAGTCDYSGTESLSVWDKDDYEEVSDFLDDREIRFENVDNDKVPYIW